MKELSKEKPSGKKGRQKQAAATPEPYRENERLVVPVTDEMLVTGSAAFRRILLEAFEQTDWVEVDCSELKDADLTFFQLLCSAHRSATLNSKKFTLKGQQATAFSELAIKMGLERHVGCPLDVCRSCIWTGGREL